MGTFNEITAKDHKVVSSCITYDEVNKRLYLAMSTVERDMEDNAKGGEANDNYDIGGNNDIKVGYNYCAAV